MENDSDVAFYQIHSSVVLARNMHRNFTKRATLPSKIIQRTIQEERILAQKVASTTTTGVEKICQRQRTKFTRSHFTCITFTQYHTVIINI